MRWHALNDPGGAEQTHVARECDVKCLYVGLQGNAVKWQHKLLLWVTLLGLSVRSSLKFHLCGAETYAHSCVSRVLTLQFQVYMAGRVQLP